MRRLLGQRKLFTSRASLFHTTESNQWIRIYFWWRQRRLRSQRQQRQRLYQCDSERVSTEFVNDCVPSFDQQLDNSAAVQSAVRVFQLSLEWCEGHIFAPISAKV